MQTHRLATVFIMVALGWVTASPSANAQYYVGYSAPRILPNNVVYPVGTSPIIPVYYGSFPSAYYSSYGYSYAAYPVVAYTYPAYPATWAYGYVYPTYYGYPSPVHVPAYYAPVYSNFYYPYGYGYYYYRGW